MSEKTQKALELFGSGSNCCQSVFLTFCEEYGMDRELAQKLTCGLGGGFKCGELCGAASAGVLVIGLKHGAPDTAERCIADTVAFMAAFEQIGGAKTCEGILGIDTATKNAMPPESFREQYRPKCNSSVAGAVELLENMGY